jgi:predicted transcriptional regulator
VINDLLSQLLDTPVKDAAPHIFERQFLFLSPDTKLFQVATFLIPAIELYIDGIVMVKEKKPIGMLASRSVLSTILSEDYPECLKIRQTR